MSFCLQAAIVARAQLDGAPSRLHEHRVELTPTLVLIPLTHSLREHLADGDGEVEVEVEVEVEWEHGFEALSKPILQWLTDLSSGGPIAYVEAEVFGGIGTQGALVLDHGARLMEARLEGIGPINQALRALGVVAGDALDEFATVNLGRHRETDRWVSTDDVTPDSVGSA